MIFRSMVSLGVFAIASSLAQDIAPAITPQVPLVPRWDWRVLPTAFHGANQSGG